MTNIPNRSLPGPAKDQQEPGAAPKLNDYEAVQDPQNDRAVKELQDLSLSQSGQIRDRQAKFSYNMKPWQHLQYIDVKGLRSIYIFLKNIILLNCVLNFVKKLLGCMHNSNQTGFQPNESEKNAVVYSLGVFICCVYFSL